MCVTILVSGDVIIIIIRSENGIFDRNNAESMIILKQEQRLIHYNNRSVTII